MVILSILAAILIFSILIFVHELGHFMAAKASGVQVNEFSMFMGPAIFKKQKGETLYSLRCIPIGGYCAMEGEDEDTDNPRSFQKAAWWKRLIILVAGAFMNFLIGFLMLMLFFSFEQEFVQPVIDSKEELCTIVYEDGLHVGDRLVKIDGYRVYTNSDAKLLLSLADETADLVVKRDGKMIEFNDYKLDSIYFSVCKCGEKFFFNEEMRSKPYICPKCQTKMDLNTVEYQEKYGITFKSEKATFGGLIPYTWDNTRSLVQSVWMGLEMLITGRAGLKDMTGPVGIVQIMSDTATQSANFGQAVLSMLYLGGFIAINLGVMNLLPFPALDGGRCVGLLLTTGIEKITKKKLDPKYEGYVHGAGMILLLLLMAVILFKDVFMIFKG